jgi:hypothetical protein
VSTALPKDRQHKYDELALYVRVDGKLTDAYQVEYEVYDDTTGLPGTPVAPGATRQDVTATDGHFATGCYGVLDIGAGSAWTPASAIENGRVVWHYTLEDGGEEYRVERKFEVLETSVTVTPGFHLFTAADLIAMSVAVGGASLTTAQAFKFAKMWTERISRYCRQQFYPKRETKRLKWKVNAHLFLPTVLYALGSFIPYEDSQVANAELLVYGGWPDGRANPKIEMEPGVKPTFGLVTMHPVDVYGVWGYFDPLTMEAPADLIDTALITIAEYVAEYIGSGAPVPGMGPVKREKVDGHEIEYAVVSTEVRSGLIALMRSPELRDQCDLHRAPIALRMTGAG